MNRPCVTSLEYSCGLCGTILEVRPKLDQEALHYNFHFTVFIPVRPSLSTVASRSSVDRDRDRRRVGSVVLPAH